jgi:hypothetical protein
LHDRTGEQRTCGILGRAELAKDVGGSGGFAKGGDVLRVATELENELVNPLERTLLVTKT